MSARRILNDVVRVLSRPVPRSLRRRIGHGLRQTGIRYLKWRHHLRADDLAQFLGNLGVRPGDVLFVHSSYDAFRAFVDLPPVAVIDVLKRAVGPEGTLLMPTIPFAGTAVGYVENNPVFDVRRTPSRMGLLTEIFRRMPNVIRSVHPTHAVAAWGKSAGALTAEHHRAATPCGVGSPYEKLLAHDGRVLMLGTGILSMTFYHTVDELLEEHLPYTPFTDEMFHLTSRDGDGQLVETVTRLYHTGYHAERRAFEERLPALMREDGTWREGRIGNLRAILVNVRDVLDALRRAAG